MGHKRSALPRGGKVDTFEVYQIDEKRIVSSSERCSVMVSAERRLGEARPYESTSERNPYLLSELIKDTRGILC